MRLDEEKLAKELQKEFTAEEVMPPPPRKKRRKKIDAEIPPDAGAESADIKRASTDGSASAPAPPIVVYITPEACAGMYDIFGKLLSVGAQKFRKAPAEIADRVCQFSESEKQMLGPQTAKVINKHAPEFLRKYADEILLVMMVSGTVVGKLKALDEVMAAMKATPVEAPPNGSAEKPAIVQ